jgi:hypothetical protein
MSFASAVTIAYFGGVALTQYTTLAQLALQNNISVATCVLGAATDLSITIILIIILRQSKSNFRKTTDMLNRMVIFSFNTGIPTSICSILTVVLIEGAPGTFVYIFCYVLMGRFYTNCLLVTLNSRDYIRGGSSAASSEQYAMSIPTVVLNSRSEISSGGTTKQGQEGINIRIDKTSRSFLDQEQMQTKPRADSMEDYA